MPHQITIEFEKIYRKAFYGKAKKRYSGHLIYKDGKPADKLDVWGFEIKRSDSSQFSKSLQERIFNMLLRENKSKDEVIRYIGDQIDRIRKGDYKLTEIGIPKGINKDLSEYGNKILLSDDGTVKHKSSVPANIRGARYAVEELGHELSNKPKMVYITKMPEGYNPTDVICFDEDEQVPPGMQIDVEKMLEKLVKDKVESIFEALGWKMSELVYHWHGKPKKEEQLLLEL